MPPTKSKAPKPAESGWVKVTLKALAVIGAVATAVFIVKGRSQKSAGDKSPNISIEGNSNNLKLDNRTQTITNNSAPATTGDSSPAIDQNVTNGNAVIITGTNTGSITQITESPETKRTLKMLHEHLGSFEVVNRDDLNDEFPHGFYVLGLSREILYIRTNSLVKRDFKVDWTGTLIGIHPDRVRLNVPSISAYGLQMNNSDFIIDRREGRTHTENFNKYAVKLKVYEATSNHTVVCFGVIPGPIEARK